LSTNTWTQTPESPSSKPSARYYHAMAYIGGNQVLLFGGDDGAFDDETWVYDLSTNTWTQDTNTTQPTVRAGHGLSETSMDGSSYLVLFGGYDGAYDDETWTFGGGDYPLPVELSSFTATGGQGMVTLEWITESESDNLGFHLYRSEHDSRIFQRITGELIAGSGNSSSPRDYFWEDRRVENGQTYWYQLQSIDFQGQTRTYGPVSATPTEALPHTYRLSQNYPNPFNPQTWISYQLPELSSVTVKIYNVRGQLVKTLLDGEQTPGIHRLLWDGRDHSEVPLASGVYFCRMKSNSHAQTVKMVLLR
ncbi:T9SS type A sorting domain-containing protein, partial [bacterium]|nr:T9SS type A sorting domain-containing protein [bacterium]